MSGSNDPLLEAGNSSRRSMFARVFGTLYVAFWHLYVAFWHPLTKEHQDTYPGAVAYRRIYLALSMFSLLSGLWYMLLALSPLEPLRDWWEARSGEHHTLMEYFTGGLGRFFLVLMACLSEYHCLRSETWDKVVEASGALADESRRWEPKKTMVWFSRAVLLIAICSTIYIWIKDGSKDMCVGPKLFIFFWHSWSNVAPWWLLWFFVTQYLVVCATARMMLERYLEKIQDIRDKNNIAPDFAKLVMEHLELAERMDDLWSAGRFGGVIVAWIFLLGTSSMVRIGLELGNGSAPVLFVGTCATLGALALLPLARMNDMCQSKSPLLGNQKKGEFSAIPAVVNKLIPMFLKDPEFPFFLDHIKNGILGVRILGFTVTYGRLLRGWSSFAVALPGLLKVFEELKQRGHVHS